MPEIPASTVAAATVHHCRESFPAFLHWLHTVDEAEPNPRERVKPLPADLTYIQHIATVMQHAPLLWVPKSRRMMLTWLNAAELVWRCLQPNTHVFLQTKKEEDADWLIKERVYFLFEYLPEWFRYVAFGGKTEASYKYCKLTFPNGSKAWGVPQGPDQFRGYTPSSIFVDEAAYQDEFDDAHTAILPLAEKGCNLRFVSSAKPSYFGEIVRGPVAGAIRRPLPGVREWDLRAGGHVLEVHYTSDPEKDPARRGKEWFKETTAKYPGGAAGSKWLQEMEIDFAAYAGQLVYEGWDRNAHVVEPTAIPKEHEGPYWRAADYGIRNPFAVAWFTEVDGVYYLTREFYESGLTVEQMKAAIHAMSPPNETYEATWIDPRSDRHEQIGETSAFFNLNRGEYSLRAQKANSSATGIEIVKQWLLDGRLKVLNTCPNFIREIENYRYEDWGAGVDDKHNLKEKAVKRDDHLMDALKYFANGVQYREPRAESDPRVISIRSRREELTHPRRGRWIGRHAVMRGRYA